MHARRSCSQPSHLHGAAQGPRRSSIVRRAGNHIERALGCIGHRTQAVLAADGGEWDKGGPVADADLDAAQRVTVDVEAFDELFWIDLILQCGSLDRLLWRVLPSTPIDSHRGSALDRDLVSCPIDRWDPKRDRGPHRILRFDGGPEADDTAVLPRIPHSNCCNSVSNQPLRGGRGRLETLLQYSRSPKNLALQLYQKSSKSASTTPQRPIWNTFGTVAVRDF